jgi:anaerobic selenocysteine-containing dehydrogenase
VELAPGEMAEWEILLRLSAVLAGQPPTAESAAAMDELALSTLAQKAVTRPGTALHGMEVADAIGLVSEGGRTGPERFLDLMLRTGPYGDRLNLGVLEANPHGVDLGPLQPRLPEVLRTPSGTIELAPEAIVEDVRGRLVPSLERSDDGSLVLVGRRDLRSNNSWMHNLDVLVKGKARCTVHVNPQDAQRLGLRDGEPACVRSRVGEVEIPVEVTDAVMAGVVSIPHGWGHDLEGADLEVAARHAGVNTNRLTDGSMLDPLSGTSVLNGIPVTVVPAVLPAPV